MRHTALGTAGKILPAGQNLAFRQAHKEAGQNKDIYKDHPKFEGFEVVI